MNQPVESIEQSIRRITGDAANSAIINVRAEAKKIGDMLYRLPLQHHKAVMAILETEAQVREQSMQLAMQEFQREQQMKAAEVAKAAEADKPQPVRLAQ